MQSATSRARLAWFRMFPVSPLMAPATARVVSRFRLIWMTPRLIDWAVDRIVPAVPLIP